jgi:hypothetical protein
MPIPGDESRIVLLADLGLAELRVDDTVLLALFALSPTPELLDVVEVGVDQFTHFRDMKPELMLAPRTPLIIIDSSHENSNQSYDASEMIFIHGARFRLIDSLFTLGDASCAQRRAQQPSFTTLADPGPYRAVHVSVEDRVAATGAECEDEKAPRPHVSTFQATYRWDAQQQRFATPSSELRRLAAENHKRL